MSIEYCVTRDVNGEIMEVDFSVMEVDIKPDIHRVYKGMRYTLVGRDSIIGEGISLDEILNYLGLEYISNDYKSDYYYELWRDTSLSVVDSPSDANLTEVGVETSLDTTSLPTLPVTGKEGPVDVSPLQAGGGVRPLSVEVTARDAQPKCCNCGDEKSLYNQELINPLVRSRPIVVYACVNCFDPAR